jgi:hypothetical protein
MTGGAQAAVEGLDTENGIPLALAGLGLLLASCLLRRKADGR